MAFADPTITISGTGIPLPRTGSGINEGQFTAADGLTKLVVRHTSGNKRVRHFMRLDNSKIAADPLLAGINVKASLGAWIVVDAPETGFVVADQKAVVDGFLAYLTASSGARITQLLGGEN
jgi:hypothetical protein